MKHTEDQAHHDKVAASLRQDATDATTPREAFAVAIRAAHYARTIEADVPTAYAGARMARKFLEEITGQKLGDCARCGGSGLLQGRHVGEPVPCHACSAENGANWWARRNPEAPDSINPFLPASQPDQDEAHGAREAREHYRFGFGDHECYLPAGHGEHAWHGPDLTDEDRS